MKNFIISASLLLLMVLLAFPLFSQYGPHMSNPAMMNMDRVFMEMMVPHHEDAVVMAKLALEKSKKSEVKNLANAIITSQTAEIEKMKLWYKTWYGTDLPKIPMNTMMSDAKNQMNHMGMMMGNFMGSMQMNMDTLKNAQDFDKTFIEMMVLHHKGAIMMSGMIIDSKKPEMRNLGNDIITAQTNEIGQMIGWYSQWYGSW